MKTTAPIIPFKDKIAYNKENKKVARELLREKVIQAAVYLSFIKANHSRLIKFLIAWRIMIVSPLSVKAKALTLSDTKVLRKVLNLNSHNLEFKIVTKNKPLAQTKIPLARLLIEQAPL